MDSNPVKPQRSVTERDLRQLALTDLLSLIQEDIQELDRLNAARRPAAAEKKPSRRRSVKESMADLFTALPPAPEEEEEPEQIPLHAVACCDVHMGDFLAFARVRCPFCGTWHRAGDFPKAS